jgi:hypothetical protein
MTLIACGVSKFYTDPDETSVNSYSLDVNWKCFEYIDIKTKTGLKISKWYRQQHVTRSFLLADRTKNGLHLSNTRCETLMFGKALWKSWNTSVWVFSRIRISRATTYKKKILHSESALYIYTKRKTRCDALSDDTQKLMYNFWCSPENSHPTGNKNDVDAVIKLTAALASSDRRCFAFLIVSSCFQQQLMPIYLQESILFFFPQQFVDSWR